MSPNVFFRFFLLVQIVGIGIDLPDTPAFLAVDVFSVTFFTLAFFAIKNVLPYLFFSQFFWKLVPFKIERVFHINNWLLSCKAHPSSFLFARTISQNQ